MRNARFIGLVLALVLSASLSRGQAVELSSAPAPAAIPLATPVRDASQPVVFWFHASLREAPGQSAPALLISPKTLGCTIFVNGAQAADCAQLPGPNLFVQRGILVHLPASSAPVSVDIRLDHPQPTKSGALGLAAGDVLYGSAQDLASLRTARDAAHFYDTLLQALLCVAELIGGAILLVLFTYDRRRREYLWFAAFLWIDGAASLYSVIHRVYPLGGVAVITFFLPGQIARYAPLIGFLAAFTGVRISRTIRGYQVALVVVPTLYALWEYRQIMAGRIWANFYDTLLLFGQIPFVAGSLIFLFVAWRKGNKEAGLLIPSFLLANGIEILGLAFYAVWGRFHVGRFGFDFDDLSMFFFMVSIAPVMLLRHRRISLEHARATAELDAAREIQQRLVPRTLPALSGCRIEAAYLPADEVGGDFYQVLPQPDGSTLIAIGDVSGKGLKAAMTGALAIGALRTLASEGLGPSTILERLNAEMVRAQNSGFVTCLCAALGSNGQLRFANAGHLPPYLNGAEVEMPGSLPLGVSVAAQYQEATVTLDAGDQLTFLSDGVVEAQNAAGELFGFERTQELSRRGARELAEAACRFGQEDDITVLTLTRLAAAEALGENTTAPISAAAIADTL